MTLATLRAMVAAAGHRNSPYMDAAIADAFRKTRAEEVWFNGGLFSFTTQADKFEYQLPKDFFGTRGALYMYIGGSATNRHELTYAPLDDLENYRFGSDEFGDIYDNEFSGTPMRYSLRKSDKVMVLAPTPQSDSDVVRVPYTKDFGTPVYTASTTASPGLVVTVTLLGPDGETLPSTFTNPWLEHGFDALLQWSLFKLSTTYHGGTDGSREKSLAASALYEQEMSRLRQETASIQSAVSITPWI